LLDLIVSLLLSARKGTAKMRETGRNPQEIHQTSPFFFYTTTDAWLFDFFTIVCFDV